jgi:hypothetical protein
MSAHTPGPWFVVEDENCGRWIFPNKDGRGFAQDGSYLAICAEVIGGANARLIAAAPDLLAALKAAIEDAGWAYASFCRCEVCEQVRAAIAKAEGRT